MVLKLDRRGVAASLTGNPDVQALARGSSDSWNEPTHTAAPLPPSGQATHSRLPSPPAWVPHVQTCRGVCRHSTVSDQARQSSSSVHNSSQTQASRKQEAARHCHSRRRRSRPLRPPATRPALQRPSPRPPRLAADGTRSGAEGVLGAGDAVVGLKGGQLGALL